MSENALLYGIKLNSIQSMLNNAEHLLNPLRYYLSDEAKRRLRWLYVVYYECDNNISQAAKKIGISREWLSKMKSKFEWHDKDPRSLEPLSRAPKKKDKRARISKDIEDKIIWVRDKYGWGQKMISDYLLNQCQMTASPSTVNRYLHKHQKICPKISARNTKAWAEKKLRDANKEKIPLTIKYRPPTALKDYRPGALTEKDMKLMPTINKKPIKQGDKYHISDDFNYQHTLLDSFTRIRALELTESSDSAAASAAYKKMKKRLPFLIATLNGDNGGENGKHFKQLLAKDETIQFYSRSGTPTDNPRVERSHRTDEQEFYSKGVIFKKFQEQKKILSEWEHTYNFLRPHQALGGLTPMAFYELWKKDSAKAYAITAKHQAHLAKERKRLANSRKIKRKEQIEALMKFVDAKLNHEQQPKITEKIDWNPFKLEIIKCELCSWT